MPSGLLSFGKPDVQSTDPPIVSLSIRGAEVPVEQAIYEDAEYARFREVYPDDKTVWDLTVVIYYRTPDGGLDGHELKVFGNSVVIRENVIEIGGGVNLLTIGLPAWWDSNGALQIIHKDDISGPERGRTIYRMDSRIKLERVKEVVLGFLEDYQAPASSANETPVDPEMEAYMDMMMSMAENMGPASAHQFRVDKNLGTVQTGLIEFLPRYAKNIEPAAYQMALRGATPLPNNLTRRIVGNYLGKKASRASRRTQRRRSTRRRRTTSRK